MSSPPFQIASLLANYMVRRGGLLLVCLGHSFGSVDFEITSEGAEKRAGTHGIRLQTYTSLQRTINLVSKEIECVADELVLGCAAFWIDVRFHSLFSIFKYAQKEG
jgi:hypothetical protein